MGILIPIIVVILIVVLLITRRKKKEPLPPEIAAPQAPSAPGQVAPPPPPPPAPVVDKVPVASQEAAAVTPGPSVPSAQMQNIKCPRCKNGFQVEAQSGQTVPVTCPHCGLSGQMKF